MLDAPVRDVLTCVAVFGAGALEALAQLRGGSPEQSVLNQVSYLSSDSRGGLASTYYPMKKPPREVLEAAGHLSEPYRQLLDRYLATMGQDLKRPILLRSIDALRRDDMADLLPACKAEENPLA